MDTSFSGQQFCLGNGFLAGQDLLLKLIRSLSLEQGSMLALSGFVDCPSVRYGICKIATLTICIIKFWCLTPA